MGMKIYHGRLRGALPFLLCFALALTGCQSRDTTSSSKNTPEPVSMSEQEEIPSSGPEEEPDEPEKEYIVDPESVAQAKEIVFELLDRVEEANDIYRGSIQRDHSMTVDMEGVDYLLVLDERLATYDDILDFWQKTFVSDGTAAKYYEEMRLNRVYTSVNGQLHVRQEISPSPMTLGQWDRSTFRLIKFEDESIEVEMNTTLVGQPNGERVLSVVNQDGTWLLDDSYFLD